MWCGVACMVDCGWAMVRLLYTNEARAMSDCYLELDILLFTQLNAKWRFPIYLCLFVHVLGDKVTS